MWHIAIVIPYYCKNSFGNITLKLTLLAMKVSTSQQHATNVLILRRNSVALNISLQWKHQAFLNFFLYLELHTILMGSLPDSCTYI